MTTALTVYLTEVASGSTLTTADVLATTTGGTLTNHTSLVGTATGYGEIYSQGNTGAWAGSGSIGSPSGHGWLLDATTLEGQQIVSGNWTPTLQFNTNSGTVTADIHVRAYVHSSGGIYTQIGSDMILTGQSITTSTASYAFSATSEAAANFGTGDKLYIDIWLNVSAGGASNTTVKVYGTSSSSQGNTAAQIVTPGYQVGVTTSHRTIPATVALLQTNTRAIPATAALLATLTRTIPATAALLQTSARTIPTSASLGALRTIPATVALLATQTRTISATVALTNTFTRTIPASVSLYQPAVFYASNVAQTAGGLTQSDFMSQILGGTETSFTITAPASGVNSYLELVSQGGTPSTNPTLPAPTGKGWSISLAGNTILMGFWFSTFTLAKSGTSMSGASLIVRWYRRTIDGVYYPIGISTLAGQTFSTTKTAYTTPSVSASLWQFISGDTLYMDAFILNGGTAWASDIWTVYVSNSATMGVVNDGTITAPSMITTPAGLSNLIGAAAFQTGAGLPVLNQSFTLADAIDQRSILTDTLEDVLGTASFVHGMPLMFSDHDQGLLYTGAVNSDKMTKPAAGGAAQLEHQMTYMDNHYLFDKRANTTNYLNWTAGDMACDFIQQTLSQEGITGAFALESDYTPATFGQGTLTNTVATTTTTPFTYAPNTATPPVTSNTGDLELSRAGTQFMLTEQTTSDFGGGTLTNMVASGNSLKPTTVNALKMQTFLAYTYGVEIAPSTISVSGGTANVTGTASVSGTVNVSTGYTPTGNVSISGGNPGESASFSGSFSSIDSSGFPTLSGSSDGSGPVTGTTASQGYQPKYRNTVVVNGQNYKVTTADAAVVDNRIDATIWTGSFTVASNDKLVYDIWISSTSPLYQAGIELFFGDGTQLTQYVGAPDTNFSVGQWDQNLVSVLPIQDLSDYAKDSWYTRQIDLAALSGKTITSVSIFNSGNQAGTYDIYVKNCYLNSQSSSPFFGLTSTVPAVNPPTVSAIGAYISPATVMQVVPVYLPAASSRVSPAHSISSVGLVQNSTITWVASLPTFGPTVTVGTPGAAQTAGQAAIFISYDNTTWLPCTNNQALPGLPAGANVSGLSFYLMETFSGGQDPTAIPSLLQVMITINSAANTTTSDITASYGTSTAWNSGTEAGTAPNGNGDLALGSSSYSWSNLNNMTYVPGNASRSNPTQSTSSGAYVITSGGSSGTSWSSSRFNFLAAVQNFTAEADFTLSDGGSPHQNEIGFVYRQTYWGSPNNSFAYYVRVMRAPGGQAGGTSVTLGYGINNPPSNIGGGPAGAFTVIIQTSQTISSGTTYHLKLVVSENRHQIYWNHGSSPIIDVLDSTYTQAGNIGLRTYVDSGSSCTGKIANLTCTNTFSGTWISPSINLNSLGTCGNTQISWAEVTGQGNEQSTAVVLASLDNGTTWKQCTNGSTTPTTSIPGLPSGTNVTGKSLLIQVILYSTGLLASPIIQGLYVRVCGSYGTVSGTRVSPALSLTPVGYVAASNAMYNANIPTSTSITVATSNDQQATWQTVGNSGAGAALSYWTNQPVATQDLFSSNTSANYTNTSKSGGSAATPTYDVNNSRITLAGGSGGLYLNNAISCTDVDLLCDMDMSDAGGLVWREVSTSNYYELGVYDASSSSGFTNQLRLYKVASGTRTLLGSASSITFTRGNFHRIRVTMQCGLINVYWDGACVQSYLDLSPLGAGACGLRNDGGTSRYYQFWIQSLGTNLSGQELYSKVTMTTSDPAQMPQLFTLVVCVRGPSIATGATISQLHPVTTPFAAYYSTEMDTAVKTSGDFYWYVDKWKQLHFGPRLARPGAFPVQSIDDPAKSSGFLLYQPQVSVLSSADLYRGQQVITDVTSLVTPPAEIKVADGSTTSWQMGYPLYSAPTITINGQGSTVGVQGIDNGRQFYWQPGSASISYDSTLPKLPAGTILSFTYVGQSTVNVILNNTASQAAQAAIELNSGIVAEIESALNSTSKGMTTAQATTFGNGLLTRYGNNNTIEMIGTTLYQGLVPGTVIPLFLPEMMQTWNAQLPIVKLTTTGYWSTNGITYFYSIDATNGPNLSAWQRVWF